MLAKRLAILLMLTENFSFYTIGRVLLVSPSTVARMKNKLDKGHFSSIKTMARNKKMKEKFWSELEVLLRAGMPEMGKGRWKWLDELDV